MADVFDFYVYDNRRIAYEIAEPIMQEDNKVTDFQFHIPKVLNGLDVSSWAWWFVYVNARDEKHTEPIVLFDDPERPLEYNVATYSVDYGMSIKAGAVKFALEAINAEPGGNIINEWHTYTYQTIVKETLQGNQVDYDESQSDIISALITQIQNKYNQLVGGATPLPVNLKSLMVDHDKVYLYTGSEDGEYTGYWYNWNGVRFVPGGVYGAGDPESVQGYVEDWLDNHPEATTTVQDGAITEAKLANGAVTDDKLTARLKILTNIDLNGIAYRGNITLPIAKSYVEAVTYLSGYYYAVCRDYSATPNTCYVAKYDSSFTLVNTVYTSATYGIANNIFNDGNRIYIDFDTGYHVSFDTSISDDFAVQNSNIRNMAYWNNTLYGVAINANNVTVYTVASDFETITELFSVATTRQTLQSASIIDGILFIPTTKGLFKFIDMETQSIIAEIPYYDSKEIENFFRDKDGTVKCSGHFYGMDGVFNIGAFDGGVDGAKMQYSGVDGSVGNFNIVVSHRYGFYNITNGIAMGLPVDTCDLLVYENAKILISDQGNCIYIHNGNRFNLIGLIDPIDIFYKVDATHDIHFRLDTDGHLYCYTGIIVMTTNNMELSIDLSDLYTKAGISDGYTKSFYAVGASVGAVNIGNTADVYAINIVVQKTKVMFRCRNLTQNTTSNINAKFEFYERIY